LELYVPEALFRRSSSSNHNHNHSNRCSAIERAQQQLLDACGRRYSPFAASSSSSSSSSSYYYPAVASGNTHTKARDYQGALHVAQQTHRAVYFVLYNPFFAIPTMAENEEEEKKKKKKKNADKEEEEEEEEASDRIIVMMNRDGENEEEEAGDRIVMQKNRPTKEASTSSSLHQLFDLPYVSLADLLRRNLQRFLQTGRFIPASVLYDMQQRTERLLRQAAERAHADAAAANMMTENNNSNNNNDDNNNNNESRSNGRTTTTMASTTTTMAAAAAAAADDDDPKDDDVITLFDNLSKFQLDQALVRLAGYELHADRTVSKRRPRQDMRDPPNPASNTNRNHHAYHQSSRGQADASLGNPFRGGRGSGRRGGGGGGRNQTNRPFHQTFGRGRGGGRGPTAVSSSTTAATPTTPTTATATTTATTHRDRGSGGGGGGRSSGNGSHGSR